MWKLKMTEVIQIWTQLHCWIKKAGFVQSALLVWEDLIYFTSRAQSLAQATEWNCAWSHSDLTPRSSVSSHLTDTNQYMTRPVCVCVHMMPWHLIQGIFPPHSQCSKDSLWIPHDPDQDKELIKNKDYPFFFFENASTLTILKNIDNIRNIKLIDQRTLAGNIRHYKSHFIE